MNDYISEIVISDGSTESVREIADVKARNKNQDLQNQIDNLVYESSPDDEVLQARSAADGTNYDTLKSRLDGEYARAEAERDEIKNSVAEIRKETFYNPFEYELKMEHNTIDGEGKEAESSNRARSVGLMNFFPSLRLEVPEGYKIRIALYDNGEFHAWSSWKTDAFVPTDPFCENFNMYTKTKFRIIIGKIDDSDLEYIPKVGYSSEPVPKESEAITTDVLKITAKNYAVGGNCVYYAADYYSSLPIPVNAFATYKAFAIRNYVLLDENLEIIKFSSSGGGTTVAINLENAKYIVFCWKNGDDNFENMAFAESNKFVGGYKFNGESENNKKYAGKVLVWTGDSIPHGQVASGIAPAMPYPKIVADSLGMILKNYSIGGTTIAHKPNYGGAFRSISDFEAAEKDTSKLYQIINGQDYTSYRFVNGQWTQDEQIANQCRTPLVDRWEFMESAEIVCVAAGTNDFQYNWEEIGEIKEIGTEFDKSTFYGALQFLCESLLDKYFSKTIIFFTPLKRAQTTAMVSAPGNGDYPLPTSRNTKGKTLKEYGEIIKEVCDLYSIPVIDFYSISGLNPSLESQSAFFDNWKTHPYQNGHDVLGKIAAAQINSLIG